MLGITVHPIGTGKSQFRLCLFVRLMAYLVLPQHEKADVFSFQSQDWRLDRETTKKDLEKANDKSFLYCCQVNYMIVFLK